MSSIVQKHKTNIFNNFNNINKENVSIIRKHATTIESSTAIVEIFLNTCHRSQMKWSDFNNPEAIEPNRETNIEKKTIKLHDMYTSTLVTKSFLNNINESFEKLIVNQVHNGMNYLELQSFLYGTSDNEPEGLLTHEDIQTIEFENITTSMMAMLNKIDNFYHNKLVWLINQEFFGELMNLGQNMMCNMITTKKDQLCVFGIPVYTLDILEKKHMAVLINIEESYCIADHVNKVETLVDQFSKKPNVEFYFTKNVGGIVLNTNSYILCVKA